MEALCESINRLRSCRLRHFTAIKQQLQRRRSHRAALTIDVRGVSAQSAVAAVLRPKRTSVRSEMELETHEEVAMRAAKLTIAALIAIPIGVLAQSQTLQSQSTQGQSRLEEGQTSRSCISNITFSQEFLAHYPKAGGACREVKVENGQKWARFDADVVRVRGNRITANFVDRYDRNLSTITFDAARDARVTVNGREMRFSSLKPGDKLSFWVPEDRAGFYAQPGASQTTKLAVVSTAPARR